MIYKMTLADTSDTMTFDLLEVPIADKDVEGAVDNTLVNGNVFTDYLWLKKQWTQKWALMCPDEYDRLRGFYTRQWSNATVPSYKLYYGVYDAESFEATGDYMLLNIDALEGTMSLSQLLGNATQTGSPTPDAPIPVETVTGGQAVTVTGKNLCPMANANMSDDGARQCDFQCVVPAGTYTVSFNLDSFTLGANTSFGVNFRLAGQGSTSVADKTIVTIDSSTTLGRKSATFTTTQPSIINGAVPSNVRIGATYWNNGGRAVVSNIQLEAGSTDSPYQPYGEEYEINLGKNLLNMTDGTYGANGVTATVSNGKITLSGTATSTSFITVPLSTPIEVDGKISISLNNTAYGDSGTVLRFVALDGTFDAVSTSTANAVGNYITSRGKYTSVQFRTPSGVNTTGATLKPQVEAGGQSTPYAPYFTPIELCKIGTYQDYIWNDNGTWKIRKNVGKITFTGSADESWAISGTGTVNYFYRYREIPDYAGISDSNILAICNMASTASIGSGNTNQGFMILNKSSSYQDIRFRYGTEKTLADWKTFLGNNNMRVYYASDAPTDTIITNTALLAQLEALQEAYLHQGTNNIMLIPSARAQGTVKIEYIKIYSQETIIIPETAVRLTLTDDGVINPCGCRRNVQLKMRETTQ